VTAFVPSPARLAHRRRRPSSPDSADRGRGAGCSEAFGHAVGRVPRPRRRSVHDHTAEFGRPRPQRRLRLSGSLSRIRGRPGQVRWPCSSAKARDVTDRGSALSGSLGGPTWRWQSARGRHVCGSAPVLVGEAVRPSREGKSGNTGFQTAPSEYASSRAWLVPPAAGHTDPTKGRAMPTSHPPAQTIPAVRCDR
jgi:hypothetical protein